MTSCIKQQNLTRPRFDDFHQIDDMRITSYASRYYLNPPAANCPTTFPVNSTTRIQKSGDSWVQGQWKTDVESDLKGIDRLGTKIRCDAVQYNPDTNMMNNIPLKNILISYFPTITPVTTDKDLTVLLDNLNNNKNIYNTYNIYPIFITVIILIIVLIIILLRLMSINYYEIYSYILVFILLILIIIGSIWFLYINNESL